MTFTFRETAHELYTVAMTAPRSAHGRSADEIRVELLAVLHRAEAAIVAAQRGPARQFIAEPSDGDLMRMLGRMREELRRHG